jgi:hypothetical protein
MNNDERIERVRRALACEYAGSDDEETLIDVLADLMHFAEHKQVYFEGVIYTAYFHYHNEANKRRGGIPPLLGRLEKENSNLCEWNFQLEREMELMRDELETLANRWKKPA